MTEHMAVLAVSCSCTAKASTPAVTCYDAAVSASDAPEQTRTKKILLSILDSRAVPKKHLKQMFKITEFFK